MSSAGPIHFSIFPSDQELVQTWIIIEMIMRLLA